MYTEVGEQMAEQNILNGNQKKLEQIIGDVKEHNTKKDRLEKLAESVKDISKELEKKNRMKQIPKLKRVQMLYVPGMISQ